MDDSKEPRKRGPKKFIVDPQRFHTTLPAAEREILESYAAKHACSLSEAVRRAVRLLNEEKSK